MGINRRFFFDLVRLDLFDGKLRQAQVSGLTLMLNHWEQAHAAQDDRWLAYILGTAHHETGRAMQPVRETFASSDEAAIRLLERAWKNGKLPWVTQPYWRLEGGKCWLGRGFVQITHMSNYVRLSEVLDVDIVTDPQVAMQPDVAVRILFSGMMLGSFTGYALRHFFSAEKADWRNARKIVNSLDRAELVASYAKRYYGALSYTT